MRCQLALNIYGDDMGLPDYDSPSYKEWKKKSDEKWAIDKAELAAQFQNALDKQIGGTHYKKFKIQPAEFCHKNNIGYLEATAIKYLCRWRDKGGIQDLDKAIHFIELLKEFENDNT